MACLPLRPLILLLLVPALVSGLLLLGANKALERAGLIRGKLDHAEIVTDLIDVLQVERGLSTGLIGSGDPLFRARLVKQRKVVNAKVAIFEGTADVVAPALKGEFTRLAGEMNTIGLIRTGVDEGTLEHLEVLRRYSVLVGDLLSLMDLNIGGSARAGDSDYIGGDWRTVSSIGAALRALGTAKDTAGQERALGGVLFGGGARDPETVRSFHRMKARERRLLDQTNESLANILPGFEMDLSAAPKDRAAFRAGLGADGTVHEVPGGPLDWFDAATGMVQSYRRAELKLISAAITVADAKIEMIERQKKLFAGAMLLLLVIFGVVQVLGLAGAARDDPSSDGSDDVGNRRHWTG